MSNEPSNPSAERKFPEVVLERIFDNYGPQYVIFQHDLWSASLVCREWHDVATKYLYKEPSIDSLRAANLFYASICANKELAPLVEKLYVFDITFLPEYVPTRQALINVFKDERMLYDIFRKTPAPNDDAVKTDRLLQIAEKCFGKDIPSGEEAMENALRNIRNKPNRATAAAGGKMRVTLLIS